MKPLILRSKQFSRLGLGITAVLALVSGVFILRLVWAALPASVVEAETAAVTAPARVITDSTAAGGKALQFAAAASGRTYDEIVLADTPVGYWAMSQTATGEPDLSGGQRSGTYMGGSPGRATLPNGDVAAQFNGATQYLSVPSSAVFSIPTTGFLAWEAWIQPSTLQFPAATDGYSDWMGKCDSYAPTCEWEARMYSTTNPEGRCNRLSAYAFNPGAGLGSAADWQPNCNLLKAGQWLHVVGQYQTKTTPAECSTAYPGDIQIWVNGIPWSPSHHRPTGCMSQYSVSPQAGPSALLIGTMAKEYWFAGAIGKVAIYNKPLSQAQISAHYTAMSGKAPSGNCASTCTIPAP